MLNISLKNTGQQRKHAEVSESRVRHCGSSHSRKTSWPRFPATEDACSPRCPNVPAFESTVHEEEPKAARHCCPGGEGGDSSSQPRSTAPPTQCSPVNLAKKVLAALLQFCLNQSHRDMVFPTDPLRGQSQPLCALASALQECRRPRTYHAERGTPTTLTQALPLRAS